MSVVEDSMDAVDTGITMGDSDGFALVCGYVEKLMEIGDVVSQIHPWANLAWSILSVIPKTLIAQVSRDSKVQCLWETAADMLAFLKDAKPVLDDILASIVSDMMKQIYHCAIFVREYGGEGFFKRTTQEILKSSDNIIAQYTTAFQQLKDRFEARSCLATLKVLRDVSQGVVQLSNILDDLRDMEKIKTLESLRGPDLEGIRCNQYAVCLPATRKALLGGIMKWVTEPDGMRTLWLNGVAGSGKSTVANTITSLFSETGLLGASFRFSQHIEPKYLFRNIAYQLALFDTRFRECLLQTFRTHGAMNSYSLREQLEKFIVEPMNSVLFVGPVLIVVDALDECGVESERREVLEAIAKGFPKLPSFIKVLLTSRNERDIRAKLTTTSFAKSIHDTEGIADDILIYIDDRLLDVIDSHPHLETTWPGIGGKRNLASRADGLFIWVTVASEYIKASSDPDGALNDVLHGPATNAQQGPEAPLDMLYLGILQRTPTLLYSIDTTKYIVGAILVAKTPLTRVGLDSLLGLGKNIVQTLRDGSKIQLASSAPLINALGSILRVDDKGLVQILHASITDFFTNSNRCTDERFFIDRSKSNCELAIHCFKAMDGLKRDICGVNDPTKFNSEILDLDERLNRHLTEDLQYSCRFWHRHLQDVHHPDNDTYNQAKRFFFTHLLHWIEVMSLLDDINGVFLVLKDTKTWFQNHPNCDADINQLIDESLHLVQRFYEPIQRSAAHVYISAIPLTPSSSIIFKVYAPKLNSLPKLISDDATPAPWTDIRPPGRGQTAISYSPDRSWLVFAGDNNKLEIWDVAGCYPLHAPLTGHGAPIHMITFSHDGTKFCSTDNNCILVWDATTYDAIGVPIHPPHSALKVSVWADKVITCDGSRQVSVWDIAASSAADHELELALDISTGVDLQGAYIVMRNQEKITNITYALTGKSVIDKYTHGRDITDVKFSPDNKKVVCRYRTNNCVSILDVHSGNIINDLLDVDASNICYPWIAFSPNGQRIIALKGKHIAIHDLDTGKLVYGLFERTYTAAGAELSLDETHLLVWDSQSFEVLDMPSGNVVASSKMHSVRYGAVISPNGHYVVVCPCGGGITIVDVLSLSSHSYDIGIASVTPSPNSRQLLFAMSDNTLRFAMDISSTNSIVLDSARSPAAFSPEGSIIASAYMDHTLQLWDTKDGKAIGKPLGGHRKVVTAIAFSPTGSRLISASDDNTIRIWSAAAGGGELLRLQAYSDIRLIFWSSDESRIIYVSEGSNVHTLNPSTGFTSRQPSPVELRWAQLLPGAKEIFYVSADGQTRLAEYQEGRITEHSTSLPTRRITDAIFSPQRTHFISISKTDLIDFSDIIAPRGPSSIARSHTFQSLTFSSNGRWLMSVMIDVSDLFSCRVCMWDSKCGQLLWEDVSDDNQAPVVAFSHSGNLAVVWSPSFCSIRNTLLGTIFSRWRTESAAQFVTFSSDEKQIICVLKGSNTLKTWNISCGTMIDSSQDTNDSAVPSEPAHMLDGGLSSAVSPDGIRLAVAHKCWTLTLHDLTDSTDKVIFEILDSPMRLLSFSPDGSKVASVVNDALIYVWDTTGHLLGQFQKDGAYIRSLALSPDGARIISICGSFSETIVQMWHVGDDSSISFNTYGDPPKSAAFFPDGARLITTAASGAIRIWDIRSTTPSSVLKSTLPSSLCGTGDLAISSDGTRLILCYFLWDIISCHVLKSFHAYTAKFSPDGTRAALAIGIGVEILDANSGATLYQSGVFRVRSMSFSVDSTQLLYWSYDGIIHVMDLMCLPTSFNIEVLSCVHPPDCMMIQPSQRDG
ncbi:hypothetical protein PILCRDRAFT_693732 [Piloderma croceum F 1598]|uniref:NACHT domain-containing protein n=1 Tax=Piloderma croceum (strain F 1598) TaxID=765440 RepID=A0A0C3ALM2_PILCF|nr:hypothetical protein PILCRDRAFT_693732 [Piloderma croceum F 1598]